MMAQRIANVLRMEWAGMARTPSSLLFLVVIPLLLIGQALFLAWILPAFLSPELAGIAPASGEGLDAAAQFRLLILEQFRFFILLIPAMIANVFATLSIVEEKVSRTLEPLLATPVRTGELLLGKVFAGAVPAIAVAWISAALFVAFVALLGWGDLLTYVVSGSWYLSIFLLTPMISLLSFVVGVIGSSRASDAKAAQNLAVLVVFPIFGVIIVQVTGLVWFTPLLTIWLSLGIAAVDAVLIRLAVRLFARESIVIRWR